MSGGYFFFAFMASMSSSDVTFSFVGRLTAAVRGGVFLGGVGEDCRPEASAFSMRSSISSPWSAHRSTVTFVLSRVIA